jgi:ribosomal protein S18 acetylase RimI-like enzyme
MKIRQAEPSEANIIAPIAVLAMGDIANRIANSSDPNEILQRLSYWISKPNNRISYQNILVATIKEQIVGVIILYEAEKCFQLDEPINIWLTRAGNNQPLDIEASGNYLYIDSIAVLPKYNGQGIGKKLLEEAFELSKNKKLNGTSLNVEEYNKKAKSIYEKQGYKIKEEMMLANKLHYYMVKEK